MTNGGEKPLEVNTIARLPVDRWAVLGATSSMVGLPTFDLDGKRSVLILRLSDGMPLLD